MQKKRTGVDSQTPNRGLTGMFDEEELSDLDSFSEGDSYDFSS